LITYFILPAGGSWDVSTVFYWCPEEIENKADKTKRALVEIPTNTPTGFVLRVKANTLRDGATNKRTAICVYDSVPMCFMIDQDAPLARPKARKVDWMT
jgi:hypothetical protein